jgi:hypothetical protein
MAVGRKTPSASTALPRRRRLAFYAVQFVTLRHYFGMSWLVPEAE